MYLDPESKPISEIFPIEGEKQYQIPIYQRNYSWSTQNIEDLFDDINSETAGYYIGNLLVTADKENKDYFEVVDGQQRLTTISLFFLAIYETAEKMLHDENSSEINEIAKDIGSLEMDISRKLEMPDQTPRVKLLLPDKEIYENYFGIMHDKTKGKYGNYTFAKRYKFIVELFQNEFNTFADLKKFFNQLNAVEVLFIKVGDISDAFNVFSSLNGKGMPLTMIDLLKAQYLKTATDSIEPEAASDSWDELIAVFSNEDSQIQSSEVTRFLLNCYDTFEGNGKSSITKGKALRLYEKVFDAKGYEYIYELTRYAKIYSHISPRIVTDEDQQFGEENDNLLNSLGRLDDSQAYPLILFALNLYLNKAISSKDVHDVLHELINFFVRRNIVLRPKASNLRAKILEIIRNYTASEDESLSKLVTRSLQSISASDEEFRLALNKPVYDVSPQTVRFILISLERKYGQYFNKQNPDSLDQTRSTKSGRKLPIWTLDHILPETNNLKHGWKHMISPENEEEAKHLQQENMHRLGNLTLTGYNPEMSDREFVYKRDYSTDDSKDYLGLRTPLFLNKSIADPDKTIEQKDEWTIKDIDRRTAYLIDKVIASFPMFDNSNN
ncbi:DUF262 domain-containing protein [Secundilactobacillus hailunensis]|uniref:DUF262 domain-containing protein n=1 Tax=Secundilactobacillus hailunensis TaxID=2559923 RepID=A0ABW1TAZ1_9LACO|nr:DUF262 domain-containing protein [Secundilactobacillus hailunensis]